MDKQSHHIDDRPRTLRDDVERERRKAMLSLPHMIDLTAYSAKLRREGSMEVPEFDPRDGGTNARMLFLFEKPGPMTAQSKQGDRSGSGFISRNNDDPTAETTWGFMRQAGIPRELTILWNVIPWWNGTRKVTSAELKGGVREVKELVQLLPNLRAVVFVGQKAANAKQYLEIPSLQISVSAHPSPLVRARFPEKWKAIPSDWKRAASGCLNGSEFLEAQCTIP